MRVKIIQIIPVILVVTLIVLPTLTNASHRCDPVHIVSSDDLKSDSHLVVNSIVNSDQPKDEQKPGSPHNEDCHCPMHGAGSCHPSAYLSGEVIPVFLDRLSVVTISEINTVIKPGPFLEGPFQPPRV